MKYYKKFGQNFLCNLYLINKISNIIKPIIFNKILEVGSGKGCLTYNLIFNYKKYNLKLIFIEIDKRFYISLKKNKFISVLNLNILNLNLYFLIKDKFKKFFIIGNIPYNLSTYIFFFFLNFIKIISVQYLMVQHEFFLKINFNKSFNSYNNFLIIFQCYYKIKKIFYIKNIFFYPIPFVNSCFLKLTPLYLYLIKLNDLKLFKCFLQKIFYKKFFVKNIYIFLKNNKNYLDFYIKIFFFYKKKNIFFYFIK